MSIKLFNSIKDYVFPVFCLGCTKEGVWLCKKCLENISKTGVFCCPVCHRETNFGAVCVECQTKSYLDGQIAVCVYSESDLIGKIVHTLKYNYAEDVIEAIDLIIKDFLVEFNFLEFDFIVSIPLYKKREVERGFNQAEKITFLLSKQLDKPVKPCLKRVKATKQQAKLNRQERLRNIKNAFLVLDPGKLKNKKILLVDDVFTTGGTMQEAAKVLKSAGAKEVVGFSLARG